MARCEITPTDNGPYEIDGDFVIKDPDGKIFDLGGRTTVWLCRCGHSGDKPFCDGHHKTVGFKSVITSRALPPSQTA